MAKSNAVLVIRIPQNIKEEFSECCEVNDETMAKVLIKFIKGYVGVNEHRVLGGDKS